jgi:hypothetical protein
VTKRLTNRQGKPLTSQAIGVLLRNQFYAGIVDVPEYGVRGKRRLRAVDLRALFYRAQAVLSGRPPSTTPQQRAPGLPTTRRESCGRGHGSWLKGRGLLFEVPLREGAARAGLQGALEADGALFI